MDTRARILTLAAMGLLGASGASAATRCVNPSGAGGCLKTIQEAVTAAAPGDRVQVAPGTYFENVRVPLGKDGLQIVGASRLTTILDPDTYTDRGVFNAGDGILIDAPGVQVRNLTIRNGKGNGITLRGPGGLIQGVTVTGPDATGISISSSGSNAQVVQCEVRNTGRGIFSAGASLILKNSVVTNTAAQGVQAFGPGAQVVGNRVSHNQGDGITVGGDSVVVRLNDVRYQKGSAILVDGDGAVLERNRVLGAAKLGLSYDCSATCAGATVSLNSVTHTGSYGILVFGDTAGLTVRGNVLFRTGRGINLNGRGIVAELNRATEVGPDPAACFEVLGESHAVTRNTATRCAGAGFYVTGFNQSLDGNTALATLENGFTVDGVEDSARGNSLSGNRTSLDAGQGFAVINGAVDTVLIGNSASKNRVDFCDEGVDTVEGSNTFGTTGACDITHAE